jgi:hypothetical protein
MIADRKTLRLLRPDAKPRGPSFSLVKRAIKLFRGRGIDKATRHRNARKWLAASASLGNKSLLKGGEPKWGQPGLPMPGQVHAPRRFGGK